MWAIISMEARMAPLFSDRVDGGRQLARRLRYLAGSSNLVVLGLPRGGVPVAFEVARALGAPLDVLVVRKLGVPGQEELAMGAIASGGVRVVNSEIVSAIGIDQATIDAIATAEGRELERREHVFRKGRPFPDLRGATVLLIDDGVATGSTMIAALRALRQHQPSLLVAAAPVMSESARAAIAREADTCISVAIPEPFYGVGQWYRDFSQTSDAEVIALLEQAAARTGQPGEAPAGNGAAGVSRL
jgi:predicted phosphoribosyltransferase